MDIKNLFKRNIPAVAGVQTARRSFGFQGGAFEAGERIPCLLYEKLRYSIPVIDAAIRKTCHLAGVFTVECEDKAAGALVKEFVETVRVGAAQRGLEAFVKNYLDSLLMYGNAVGEIVLSPSGDSIYSLYNADISDLDIALTADGTEVVYSNNTDGTGEPLERPELILFTPLSPKPGQVMGNSILKSIPFVSSILLSIFESVGQNFERVGNLRFAVTYKPSGGGAEKNSAKDIAQGIAGEWSQAMAASRDGTVRDFVSVGDIDIKVIGADSHMPDIQVPVRALLEQVVAVTSMPPFLLGLSWSSTERMSAQQTDILTSELESLRRTVVPVMRRIIDLFLATNGMFCRYEIVWEDINLQDTVGLAQARLMEAQARKAEETAPSANE